MSIKLNVVGYFVHKETCEEIEAILGRINTIVSSMHLQDGSWSLRSLSNEVMPDIIIHEVDGNDEETLQDLEKIIKENPQVTVYVTYKDGDMDIMRRLMRAGVHDTFPQPVHTQELVNAMTKVISMKRAYLNQSKGGKGGVTSFISAKGGSGATTIAVNVAEILANAFEAKVLLIDLDIQFGDGSRGTYAG